MIYGEQILYHRLLSKKKSFQRNLRLFTQKECLHMFDRFFKLSLIINNLLRLEFTSPVEIWQVQLFCLFFVVPYSFGQRHMLLLHRLCVVHETFEIFATSEGLQFLESSPNLKIQLWAKCIYGWLGIFKHNVFFKRNETYLFFHHYGLWLDLYFDILYFYYL